MKLLAFAATSSRESINKQLVAFSAKLLEKGLVDQGLVNQDSINQESVNPESANDVTVEIIDLNDFEMPIYSIDRQNKGGIPQLATDFFNAIGAADALLISFAEHNGSYTAAYKNLFDWASRVDMRVYQDTPTVMLSTSVGPGGGANVLRTAVESASFFGNEVLASLSVPSFHENFDAVTGEVKNPELDAKLREALTTLVAVKV